MNSELDKAMWRIKSARAPGITERLIMLVMFMAGVASVVNLAEWWFRKEHIINIFFFALLSVFFWYGITRIVLVWINYLRVSKPLSIPVPEAGLSVAVFTTAAPGEPASMFINTFKALKNLNYPHTTYLLDSSEDPEIEKLADEFGIKRLNLINIPGAKAGKVNKALSMTDEEFILILDPDHIVFPEFLDQTLGFFKDESVGFVQVSQGYYNMYRSFVARAAAEQTFTFYGPTQMGLSGYGGALAIGANCTFRRKALESTGGHAQGLAEDLQTSIRIHAKGWKSVYNPVIVSRGLVPEDFTSFSKQQLKWARGVFELLFDEIPYKLKTLTFWQKVSYLSIGTYYLFGSVTFFFLMIPFLFFITDIVPVNMDFTEFIAKGISIFTISIAVYAFNQRFLVDPVTEKGFHWRGMIMKYASWPVFFYAFILTLMHKKIPYIATPKIAEKKIMNPFVAPLIIYNILFLISVTGVFIRRRYFMGESELIFSAQKTWGMIGFSLIAFIQSLGGILASWEASGLSVENAWDRISVNEDKSFDII